MTKKMCKIGRIVLSTVFVLMLIVSSSISYFPIKYAMGQDITPTCVAAWDTRVNGYVPCGYQDSSSGGGSNGYQSSSSISSSSSSSPQRCVAPCGYPSMEQYCKAIWGPQAYASGNSCRMMTGDQYCKTRYGPNAYFDTSIFGVFLNRNIYGCSGIYDGYNSQQDYCQGTHDSSWNYDSSQQQCVQSTSSQSTASTYTPVTPRPTLIVSINAGHQNFAGDPIVVQAQVSTSDGSTPNNVSYSWGASSGIFESSNVQSTRWTPPIGMGNSFTINVSVSADGFYTVMASTQVTVHVEPPKPNLTNVPLTIGEHISQARQQFGESTDQFFEGIIDGTCDKVANMPVVCHPVTIDLPTGQTTIALAPGWKAKLGEFVGDGVIHLTPYILSTALLSTTIVGGATVGAVLHGVGGTLTVGGFVKVGYDMYKGDLSKSPVTVTVDCSPDTTCGRLHAGIFQVNNLVVGTGDPYQLVEIPSNYDSSTQTLSFSPQESGTYVLATVDSSNGPASNLITNALNLEDDKKYDEAKSLLDQALALEPQNFIALNSKGWVLLQQGKYDEANQYLDQSLAIEPNFVLALDNKAYVLISQNKYNDANAYVDRSLALNPNNEYALDEKGYILSQSGHEQDAITYFEKASQINPQHYGIYINEGNTYYQLGQWDNAITEYDKYLTFIPTSYDVLEQKGAALINLGKYQAGTQNFDSAYAVDPNDASGDYILALNMARGLVGQGKYDDSIQFYDKVMTLQPDIVQYQIEKAAALSLAGKYDQAKPILDNANQIILSLQSNEQINGVNAGDYLMGQIKGITLFNQGQYDQAIPYFENSLKKVPHVLFIEQLEKVSQDKMDVPVVPEFGSTASIVLAISILLIIGIFARTKFIQNS